MLQITSHQITLVIIGKEGEAPSEEESKKGAEIKWKKKMCAESHPCWWFLRIKTFVFPRRSKEPRNRDSEEPDHGQRRRLQMHSEQWRGRGKLHHRGHDAMWDFSPFSHLRPLPKCHSDGLLPFHLHLFSPPVLQHWWMMVTTYTPTNMFHCHAPTGGSRTVRVTCAEIQTPLSGLGLGDWFHALRHECWKSVGHVDLIKAGEESSFTLHVLFFHPQMWGRWAWSQVWWWVFPSRSSSSSWSSGSSFGKKRKRSTRRRRLQMRSGRLIKCFRLFCAESPASALKSWDIIQSLKKAQN